MRLEITLAVAVTLLLLAPVFAQETPLQVAANLTPVPEVVVPGESYLWQGKLIADKLAEMRAERREGMAVYYAEEEHLFQEVKLDENDEKKYLALDILSYPQNLSWDPLKGGIEAAGGGYTLYNDFFIHKYSEDEVTLKPVYHLVSLDEKVGDTVTIQGDRYLVLEYSPKEEYVEIARARESCMAEEGKVGIAPAGSLPGIRLGGYRGISTEHMLLEGFEGNVSSEWEDRQSWDLNTATRKNNNPAYVKSGNSSMLFNFTEVLDNSTWYARTQKNYSALDTSGYSRIGFWVYPRTDYQGTVKLALQVRDGDDGTFYSLDFKEVEANQWNFIKYDLSDFTTSGLDPSRIRYVEFIVNQREPYPIGTNIEFYIDGLKLLRDSPGRAVLQPYDGNGTLDNVVVEFNNSVESRDLTEELRDYFPGYEIHITETKDDYLCLGLAEKSQSFRLHNGQGAFGYSTTWLPRSVGGHGDSLVMVGGAITLEEQDLKTLEGTPYSLRLSDSRLSISQEHMLGSFKNGTLLHYGDYERYLRSDVELLIDEGKVKLRYFTNELDDETGSEDDFVSTECGEGKFLVRNCSTTNWSGDEGLRSDTSSDGELGSEDTVIFNDFYVWEYTHRQAEILPLKVINITENRVVDIWGKEYYILDSDPGSIKALPAREVKLPQQPELKPGIGREVGGGYGFIAMKVRREGNKTSFNLYLTKNESIHNTFKIKNATPGEKLGVSEALGKKVYMSESGENYIKIVIQTGEEEDLTDGDPWGKYSEIRMDFPGLSRSEALLRGDAIKIGAGEVKKMGTSRFYISYWDGKVDIRREKTIEVEPGEHLYSDRWPWSDFLKADLTLFLQEMVKYPEVKVREAGEAGRNSSLILIGNHKNNRFIKKLVEENRSQVEWGESGGNIEVVDNAFSNSTAIIVGGRTHKDVVRAVQGFIQGATMEYVEVEEEGGESVEEPVVNKTTTSRVKEERKEGEEKNQSQEVAKDEPQSFLDSFLLRLVEFLRGLLGEGR